MMAPEVVMTRLRAARVFDGAQLRSDGWVDIAGDRIVAVGGEAVGGRTVGGEVAAAAASGEVVDLGDVTLAPGFVDGHCHGGGGAAFTDGAAAARTAAAMHHRHGTTTLVASLVTDGLDALERQVRALAPLVAADELAGIHLEGPWLSPAHRGAHRPDLLRDSDPVEVTRLLDAGGGAVRMVTLAPELPGGMAAVRVLADRGVLAALGHSDASYAQACEAIEAGANVATHLYNAERGMHHREPGPVPALLDDPRVVVELIADGVHVHPAMVAFAASRAAGGFVLVTDAMAAAGAADGDYLLGPLEVRVTDGVARVVATGAIAGSTLTLDRAVRFAVAEAGLPLPDVLAAATSRPARLLGRDDLGRLAAGAYADLVALDAELRVAGVMRRGDWLRR